MSSTFEGVSSALPALARAQAIGERAARIGFDWPDVAAAWRKVNETMASLRAAQGVEAQGHELGSLLFSLAGLARWLKLDAESALREATARFMARVVAIEEEAVAAGREPQELTPAEVEELWQRVRARG